MNNNIRNGQYRSAFEGSNNNKGKGKVLLLDDDDNYGDYASYKNQGSYNIWHPGVNHPMHSPFSTPVISTQDPFGGGGLTPPVLLGKNKKQKLPLSLFTDTTKSRLRWTPRLHDRFVQAIMMLGGLDKVTPALLKEAMGLEGLSTVQVKSHLQKFRSGQVAVREWYEPRNRTPKTNMLNSQNSSGLINCNFSGRQEPIFHENRSSNVKRRPKKYIPGEFYLQLHAAKWQQNSQEAHRKYTELVRDNASNQIYNGMQQKPYFSIHNSSETIPECVGLEKEYASFVPASHQQPLQVHVDDASAVNGGGFMASSYHGYSFPGPCNSPTSSDVNNVQVGLKEQPPGFQNQIEVYNIFQPAAGNGAHMFAPAQNGGALGNIQLENSYFSFEPQKAATYTVQAQNANASSSSCAAIDYSETAYFNDYNAALASTGVVETTEEDPLEAYINWDNSDLFTPDFE